MRERQIDRKPREKAGQDRRNKMKKVILREWKDLSSQEQQRNSDKVRESLVEAEMSFLGQDLEEGRISEDEYYAQIGCSKMYAETTAWFVPSCYYDGHKESVDANAMDILKSSLFDKSGNPVEV